MSASLVGSEMCIRDRASPGSGSPGVARGTGPLPSCREGDCPLRTHERACLLYTSDAADDM
eukprot:15332349-Alexandrium_andersonii.AAC.1